MSETTAKGGQPLDEVMMAMDVVDTLRRRERLVTTELAETDRREDLKKRLRDIYDAQGIKVSDATLEEGVQALAENRFVFDPPRNSLAVRLARLYVTRDRWGKWVLGGIAVLIAAVFFYIVTVAGPNRALPGQINAAYDSIAAATQEADALAQAAELQAIGTQAAAVGQTGDARQALAQLEQMRDLINLSYTLQVVNKPGLNTGVWRVPDANTGARNYYIIVEALDATGRPVQVPVVNEETGQTQSVSMWGLRVDEAVFEQIAADKGDDGIIQNNEFGRKARGQLVPEYFFPTSGAAITSW